MGYEPGSLEEALCSGRGDMNEIQAILERDAKLKRRKLPILQDNAPKDCNSCGACCSHYEMIDFARNDPEAKWLLKNGYAEKVEGKRDRLQMKLQPGNRCMALAGIVGEETSCSIYDHRPMTCRNYQAGGSRCRTRIMMDILPECSEGIYGRPS